MPGTLLLMLLLARSGRGRHQGCRSFDEPKGLVECAREDKTITIGREGSVEPFEMLVVFVCNGAKVGGVGFACVAQIFDSSSAQDLESQKKKKGGKGKNGQNSIEEERTFPDHEVGGRENERKKASG